MPLCVQHREPREGWPLLTNETEVNGDSKSTNERGPSVVDSLGMSCRYNSLCFCSALATLVCPGQNIFSSSYTIPIQTPSKQGWQWCWVAWLLVSNSRAVADGGYCVRLASISQSSGLTTFFVSRQHRFFLQDRSFSGFPFNTIVYTTLDEKWGLV